MWVLFTENITDMISTDINISLCPSNILRFVVADFVGHMFYVFLCWDTWYLCRISSWNQWKASYDGCRWRWHKETEQHLKLSRQGKQHGLNHFNLLHLITMLLYTWIRYLSKSPFDFFILNRSPGHRNSPITTGRISIIYKCSVFLHCQLT